MDLRTIKAIGLGLSLTTATVAVAKEEKPAKVMPNGEKIICKRTQDTSSLARFTRQCFTRAEWDRIAEAARENGQRMVSDHASGLDCRASGSC